MSLTGRIKIRAKDVEEFTLDLLYYNTMNSLDSIVKEHDENGGVYGRIFDEEITSSDEYFILIEEFKEVFGRNAPSGHETFLKFMTDPKIADRYYEEMIARNEIRIPILENFPLLLIAASGFSLFSVINNAKDSHLLWIIVAIILIALIYLIRALSMAARVRGYDGKRVSVGIGRQPKVISEKAEALELVQYLMIKYRGSLL